MPHCGFVLVRSSNQELVIIHFIKKSIVSDSIVTVEETLNLQSVAKCYGNFKKCIWNSPSLPIQCCEPITWLDASFAHCSSTLLRGGRGEKHKIVQIAVFPIIFVTDCLKHLQNLKCGILELLILSQIPGMHLLITSLLYKP